jgi:hypothetical protein
MTRANNNNNKTFVVNKITFEEMYRDMQDFHQKNSEQHEQIIKRLDATNGKVKLSKWLATTALTITLLVLGFLIQHINK